ncbi:uncharacterized protein LOC143184797 [Calliopsis andreniformis]|uniref:uncharacterized protein LOC143184797 n=1 Tax=Calliopsis andreniformis TaxID=337506 RepID=UPI003FCE8199
MAVLIRGGKLEAESLMATSGPERTVRRLFVTDGTTRTQYLIDTGAEVSVFPRKKVNGARAKSNFLLTAANGSLINTYGQIVISVDLRLRRAFPWTFIIADIERPIIGADFLARYGLLPDVQDRRLIDKITGLSVPGTVPIGGVESAQCVAPVADSEVYALLKKYECITRPAVCTSAAKHEVKHHIVTTPGPPVSHKPRRLTTDRLKAAK